MPAITKVKVRHNGVDYPIGSTISVHLSDKDKERLIHLQAIEWTEDAPKAEAKDPDKKQDKKSDKEKSVDPVVDQRPKQDGEDLPLNLSLPAEKDKEEDKKSKAK